MDSRYFTGRCPRSNPTRRTSHVRPRRRAAAHRVDRRHPDPDRAAPSQLRRRDLPDHRRPPRPCARAAPLIRLATAHPARLAARWIMKRFESSGTGARVALAAALATFAASGSVSIHAAGTPLEFYKVENGPPGMTLPFSEAVRAGDMLYLAGMVGTDASGK